MQQVNQLMSQPAVVCRPDDTLATAAKKMWQDDCGVVPVVDGENRLVGIITDRDICMAAFTRGEPLTAIPVHSAMAKQVYSCRPEDSIEAAQRVMSEKQIRRLAVVDESGHAIGVLSLNDLAREAASPGWGEDFRESVMETMAAICQPREQAMRARPEERAAPGPPPQTPA